MPNTEISTAEREHPAIFDAGIFTILNVSQQGFLVHTRESKRRRDVGSPFPLNNEQVAILRSQMQGERGEIAYARNKADRLAREEGREVTTQDYARSMVPKVGIREITQEDWDGQDVLSFDTRPVTFPVYSDLVTRGENNALLLDFAELTGTAAAIFTADDNPRLIVQYRGRGNRVYGNIPGASAAGILDGEFNRTDPTKRGTLLEIDPRAHLRTEITEELGIDTVGVETRILAVAHDEVMPHHEIIISATIPYTAQDLAEKGLIPDEVEGRDFRERYFTIDGTPGAIDALLTQVKCPLPSTHAAAFFMAGYQKMLERDGGDAAYSWARDVAGRIKQNYAEIDNVVKSRYKEFPTQLDNRPVRSMMGYDPLYTPEEQGISSLLDELFRSELISKDMYSLLQNRYGFTS